MPSDEPEQVPLMWDTVQVERCTNADALQWQAMPGQQNQSLKLPSRCQGFFGRLLGLYFDTLPMQREMAKLEQEEHDWGYGGVHEGAQRWAERPSPPSPPQGTEAPATVEFVTSSGSVVSSNLPSA